MKKTLVFAALAATIALVSCNKDMEIRNAQNSNPDLGINFKLAENVFTRATETTVANIGGFKVTAIGNGANFFTDLDVAVTSAGVCTPEKTYYWPGYELGFYAHNLQFDSSTDNWYPGWPSIGNANKMIMEYTPVAVAANQHDLIIAYNTGRKADNMASGVALNFRHALSQIKVKATNKSTAGLKINVKGVKVANVKESGDFSYPATVTSGNNAATLDFALWDSSSASKTAYTIGGASETAVALSATAADIMFSGSSWMLVPQQLVAWNLASDKTNSNANAYIGVYLQILDANNGQLYPATAGQYAYANVPIDTKWEPGKTYTYTLNFLDEAAGGGAGVDDAGNPVLGSPINFTLTIDDWDGTVESNVTAGMVDTEVEKPGIVVTPATFGGLQLASGDLYYDGTSFSVDNTWNEHNTYNVSSGKTSGVTSSYFTLSQIQSELPLNNWRLPTLSEWRKIMTTNKNIREGSSVNGRNNAHWAVINVSGISYAGRNNIKGYLLFPDGKTISGTTINVFDNLNDQIVYDDETGDELYTLNYITSLSSTSLDEYLEQGCVFLPLSGDCYNGNFSGLNTTAYYHSSTTEDEYIHYHLRLTDSEINDADAYFTTSELYPARLVLD